MITNSTFATKISDGLYIGALDILKDKDWLTENKIDSVLNVSEVAIDLAILPNNLQETYQHILVDDETKTPFVDQLFDNTFSPEDFWQFLSKAADEVLNVLENEENALIVCEEGINRSVSVALAFLILYEEKEFKEALEIVTKANLERTKIFLVANNLELPENKLEFPTLTNTDFKDALQHLAGAFDEEENSEANELTKKYCEAWEKNYLDTQTESETPKETIVLTETEEKEKNESFLPDHLRNPTKKKGNQKRR